VNNTLDLSLAVAPLTINVVTGTAQDGSGTIIPFTDIQTFVGSASGDTTFIAGSESSTFTGQGTNNRLDLSGEAVSPTTPLTINASGIQVQAIVPGTAQVGSTSIQFTDIQTFVGAASGDTTFITGSESSTFIGQGTNNTLDFGFALTSSLTINAVTGTAQVASVNIPFTDIQTFVGLATGDTTFIAGSESSTFTGQGTNNTLDLSGEAVSPTTPLTINAVTGTAQVGSISIQFTDIQMFVGAATGDTTFIAGSESSTFTGQGTNNRLDLSGEAVSPTTPLTINAVTGTAQVGSTSIQFTDIQTFEVTIAVIATSIATYAFVTGAPGQLTLASSATGVETDTLTGYQTGDTIALTTAAGFVATGVLQNGNSEVDVFLSNGDEIVVQGVDVSATNIGTMLAAPVFNGTYVLIPSNASGDLGQVGGNTAMIINGASTSGISFGTGNGADTVFGGTDDTINIGNGNDTVWLIGNGNIVTGGNGADHVNAGPSDNITLGNGNDLVTAGANSTITPRNGADTVTAGASSTINVGNGNDTIHVGKNDTVTVGTGQDTFIFGQTTAGNIGAVTITGFNPSKDVIVIQQALVPTKNVLPAHDDVHGNALITVDNSGDTITLVGVHSSALHASDFQFV
jgi:hypothetical protein